MKEETKRKIKEAIQLALISILCTGFVLSFHNNDKKQIKETPQTKIITDSIKQYVR